MVFGEKNENVAEMKSQEGELVPLGSPVHIEINVERWLGALANQMKATLSNLLVSCLEVSVLLDCTDCSLTLVRIKSFLIHLRYYSPIFHPITLIVVA